MPVSVYRHACRSRQMLAGLVLFASAVAKAAEPAAIPYDHYHPLVLNEYAVAKAAEGDSGLAAILLERAALLAPHDPRIAANRDALSAFRQGQPAPVRHVEVGGAAPAAPPQPLPLW